MPLMSARVEAHRCWSPGFSSMGVSLHTQAESRSCYCSFLNGFRDQHFVHVLGLKIHHTCRGVLRYISHIGNWDLACGFIRVWATPPLPIGFDIESPLPIYTL